MSINSSSWSSDFRLFLCPESVLQREYAEQHRNIFNNIRMSRQSNNNNNESPLSSENDPEPRTAQLLQLLNLEFEPTKPRHLSYLSRTSARVSTSSLNAFIIDDVHIIEQPIDVFARLRATRRTCTGHALPKSFFASIQWMLADATWYEHAHCLLPLPLDSTPAEMAALSEHLARDMATFPHLTTYMDSFRKKELDYRRVQILTKLKELVPKQVDAAGFRIPALTDSQPQPSVAEQLQAVLRTPLAGLASHVVHSIKGYYHTDPGDSLNRATRRTDRPLVFVSAAEPDFSSPLLGAAYEVPRYFVTAADGSGRLVFGEGRRSALQNRLASTYTLIMQSFEVQGVRVGVMPILAISQTPPELSRVVAEVSMEALAMAITSYEGLLPSLIYLDPSAQHLELAVEFLSNWEGMMMGGGCQGGERPALMPACSIVLQCSEPSCVIAHRLSALYQSNVGLVIICNALSILSLRPGVLNKKHNNNNDNWGYYCSEAYQVPRSTLMLQHYDIGVMLGNGADSSRLDTFADSTDFKSRTSERWQPVCRPDEFSAFSVISSSMSASTMTQ
eukprot:PhM_4_TR82/c0_g1_i1/m.75420